MAEAQATPVDLAALAARFPELLLLVLHGSRARGDARGGSDWDFGYEAAPGLDALALRLFLVVALGTDEVDLADLDRAGGVLRYRAASEGVPWFERDAGAFERFALRAIFFWLDARHAIEPAHEELLRGLG